MSRRGPRKRSRTKRAPFQTTNETPLPPDRKRQHRGVGTVHPNSMAARKLGLSHWNYGSDPG